MKDNYLEWRDNLWEKTKKLLTSSNPIELSRYNHLGYYHKVRQKEHFDRMQDDWKRLGRVPEEWIYKGNFPGIWTAMLSPHNTYSISTLPIFIIRFFFRDGFFIYDNDDFFIWDNEVHRKIKQHRNPWSKLFNESGVSLEERMRFQGLPHHRSFYEDNKFGAFVGYSDYLSAVIILPESIESVEFMTLTK